MVKKTIYDLAAEKYTDAEMISSAFNVLKMGDDVLREAIAQQNLGLAGEARQLFIQAFRLLQALNEKLNGKKEATVVQ